MINIKKLLTISVVMLCMVKLWAQPMAFHGDVFHHMAGDIHTSPSTSTEDSRLLSETLTESYLQSLIWDEGTEFTSSEHENRYRHIVDFLEKLEEEKGSNPFFFDAYYHPLAQQMSGFTFGYAGLPIAHFDTLANNDISIHLTTKTPKAAIHYTLDGSIPNESSPVWDKAMMLDDNLLIRAKTIRSDLEHSPVLRLTKSDLERESSDEVLGEDKIMGIFSIPETEDVIIKYKTKEQGFITISLIDDQRQSYYIDEILAMEAQFGMCRINTSDIAEGAYLIKFRFDSGKTMYRQMMKE